MRGAELMILVENLSFGLALCGEGKRYKKIHCSSKVNKGIANSTWLSCPLARLRVTEGFSVGEGRERFLHWWS
jgi:hypothetical protein